MEKFKDLNNENINNTKVYKNKPISENYWIEWTAEIRTPEINIWTYGDHHHHHHHHVSPSTRISLILSWSFCFFSSMWRGSRVYVTYEFVPISPAASCMSGSSNSDIFCDGWKVAVELLLCRVLFPELIQYCSQQNMQTLSIWLILALNDAKTVDML